MRPWRAVPASRGRLQARYKVAGFTWCILFHDFIRSPICMRPLLALPALRGRLQDNKTVARQLVIRLEVQNMNRSHERAPGPACVKYCGQMPLGGLSNAGADARRC